MSSVIMLLVIIICLLVVIGYIVWNISMMVAEIYGATFIQTEGVAENATTTDEVGDCNICRFAGCSECDDCVNGSQWVREVEGVDFNYDEQERLYDELADMRGAE